MHVGF